MTDTKQKCIALNCDNHRHGGKFVGDLCAPCHTFISTGAGVYSQAYRNTKREWVSLTDEDINFWAEELGQEELGKGVLRAVDEYLKEKNT
jgi:hypothetical protein